MRWSGAIVFKQLSYLQFEEEFWETVVFGVR